MGRVINWILFPFRLVACIRAAGEYADEALEDLERNGPPWSRT